VAAIPLHVATSPGDRLAALANEWAVTLDSTAETTSSLIGFGRRASEHVVLKIVKREGDEWRSGEVLEAFAARGVVRVLENTGGAVLMERASPGHRHIPTAVVDTADATYAELCRTQRNPRLLHGDLQHSNVLLDHRRGWVAIDPKGVVGGLHWPSRLRFGVYFIEVSRGEGR